MGTTRRFLILACAAAVGVATGAAAASPVAEASGTYVALGDSVAAPADSYVSVFFQFLRTREAGGLDTLSNRAVSGADSSSLRSGQLTAAIADIDGPSDTKIVTIDIGGNDRFQCGGSPPSWHLVSCPFAANFDATLADLQAALGRDPGSEALITMAYYSPASGTGITQEQQYDLGLLGTDLRISCAPSGDPRLGLNDRIVCISGSRGARVADVYPAFKLGGQALRAATVYTPRARDRPRSPRSSARRSAHRPRIPPRPPTSSPPGSGSGAGGPRRLARRSR